MSYLFKLTDLRGVEQSELPGALSKRVAVPVCSMGTASTTVRISHDMANFMLGGDALVKVYDVNDDFLVDGDRLLVHHGRLVSAEEVATADGGTVAAAFADPFWILLRRLLGKSPSGYSRGTAVAPVDRGTIVGEVVADTNAESPSGVRMGVVEPSSSTYVAGWYYKKIGEAIAELSATLDGPDWRVRPIEYANGYYGELDVLAAIGQPQANAAFEYGPEGLANVSGYKRVVSLEGTANRFFHLPPGFPDNAAAVPLSHQHDASIAARGLLEDVVASDLSVDDLRLKLLHHHVAVRNGPRQTIDLTPVRDVTARRVPRLGRDFNVGDMVPFRAAFEMDDGTVERRVDAFFRLYQWAVDVDKDDAATPTATVVPSA